MNSAIPHEIVRFLEGATVGYGATRDRNLVPRVHRVECWLISEDRRAITCLFAADHGNTLIPSLEDNGRFSLTVLGSTTGAKASDPPNPSVDLHECYQFKGDYTGTRPVKEEDLPVVSQTAERFRSLFHPMFGFSDGAYAARFGKPVLAVTFEVQEIYDQTPGPGAGAKIEIGAG